MYNRNIDIERFDGMYSRVRDNYKRLPPCKV